MKILIFGDSIAQGRSDPEFFGWANRLAVWTQQEAIRTDWETAHLVCNMGNAGDETTDVLGRFKQEFLWRRGGKDALVIFQVGINDAAHRDEEGNTLVPLTQAKKNYETLLQQAQELATYVVVLGLTRVDESKVNPYIDSSTGKSWLNRNVATYDEMVMKAAQQYEVLYIPLADLITSEMCEDGLHPNAEGHRLIFERVKSELEKAGIL